MVRHALFTLARGVRRLPRVKGQNRLFAIIMRLAQRLGPPIVVDVEGFSMQLDMRDGLCRDLWASRSPPQGSLFAKLCQPGDVVIDVGANIGYVALMAARQVGPTGRVIAVEPGPRSFLLLQTNAERNFPDRIVPVHAACDEVDGTATLFVSDYSEENNSLRLDPVVGGAHEETVTTRSLCSLCQEMGITPDVVKIDVEGAEWRVLNGLLANGTDRAAPRLIFFEVYIGNSRAFGYRPSELCRWIEGQGYRIVSLSRETEQFLYSDERADGPLLHDVVALRSDLVTPAGPEFAQTSAEP
jgi:FkbM family methyltransferase